MDRGEDREGGCVLEASGSLSAQEHRAPGERSRSEGKWLLPHFFLAAWGANISVHLMDSGVQR